jgi:electron transfer flavoprotein alpha subunit
MGANVLILVEHWRGQISDGTYEALALGREISDALGGRLEAALLGAGVREAAGKLGAADGVILVEHRWLEEPIAELWSEALAQVVKTESPRCVLIPLSNVTLEMGTLAAARLRAAGIVACRDLSVSDGRLSAKCQLYGGKMVATVESASEPLIIGVAPGARPAEKARLEGSPAVRELAVELEREPRIRFCRYIEPEAGDIDITQQPLLVSVGRGIQNQENIALAEELAASLGGAVAGSRPVIDQGWLPMSRQVGKSGMTVKPKLYLALGISGAPEHQEGMRDSELIIAVNTDRAAPIFQIAHYGAAIDCLELIPALTEQLKAAGKAKGA